ncbi:MAG TPA: hypothetical protein VK718_03175 [Ferruginibacter sp.]|jgi:hypothetical protein|nr:hypothetical protein [Ferruginibacter sp.]
MKTKKAFSPNYKINKVSFRGLGVLLLILLVSCHGGNFINHDLKAERIGDCSATVSACILTSNTFGEHYQFDRCLIEGFNADDYLVERVGDTLVLTFPKEQANEQKALYKLTLDIQASPRYNYIRLGNEVLQINALGN